MKTNANPETENRLLMPDSEAQAATLPKEGSSSIALAEEHPSSLSLLAEENSAPCTLHSSPKTALVETKPLRVPACRRKIRRNGHVACLPKVQRDMVNRMLWNAIPYKKIVAA